MAIKWTSERNERLLLLVIKDIKVDAAKLAKVWKEQYGNDEFQPTARAITEQFTVLKKKAGGKGRREAVSTPSTPKLPSSTHKPTPRKSTMALAAPTITPSKRKKTLASDDEEGSAADDDEDSELDLKNLPKAVSRTSLARVKKMPKRYEEPDSDSEHEKADDESDDGPRAISSMDVKSAAAAGRRININSNGEVSIMNRGRFGDEIHVADPTAKAATNGHGKGERLDSIMGDLMDGAPPSEKSRKAVKKGGGEVKDDSDISDFATSFD